MTTMLEQAARAAAYGWHKDDSEHDDAMHAADNEWPDFVPIARAVLMAVREPGIGTWIDSDCDDDTHPISCFTAMIDAILNEGEK